MLVSSCSSMMMNSCTHVLHQDTHTQPCTTSTPCHATHTHTRTGCLAGQACESVLLADGEQQSHAHPRPHVQLRTAVCCTDTLGWLSPSWPALHQHARHTCLQTTPSTQTHLPICCSLTNW